MWGDSLAAVMLIQSIWTYEVIWSCSLAVDMELQ